MNAPVELRDHLVDLARLLGAEAFAEFVNELADDDPGLVALRRECRGYRPFPSGRGFDLLAAFGPDTRPHVIWKALLRIELSSRVASPWRNP